MISLVAYGTAFSNVEALDGYIATIDPGLWLARAALAKDAGRADSYRELAEKLEEWGIHDGQRKIYRRLYADFTRLRAGLAAIDPPGTRIGEDARQALILLHAIRIALIQEIYIMATRIPEFSSRHGFGNGGVFRQILQLGIDSAVANLRKIFPAQAKETSDIDFR